MEKLTHKEKMDYVREHDPILYYELIDNPTGSNGDSFSDSLIGFIILSSVLGFITWLILK